MWNLSLVPPNENIYLLFLQCNCDDDVINFKRIMRQWINKDNTVVFGWEFESVSDTSSVPESGLVPKIPFSHKYLQMARADYDYQLDSEIATALAPETDMDRQELTLWLNDLLYQMHRELR